MREVSTLPRKPFSCAFVVIQILTSITPNTYESTTEFVCSSSGRMNMCRCPHRIRNSAIRRRQMINAFRHTSFKCVHFFLFFSFLLFLPPFLMNRAYFKENSIILPKYVFVFTNAKLLIVVRIRTWNDSPVSRHHSSLSLWMLRTMSLLTINCRLLTFVQ